MTDAASHAKSRARAAPTGNFVVKDEHGDGSVTWVDTQTAEEIRLHVDTPPTRTLLEAMAKNGIVPKRPTLEDHELEQQSNFGDGDPGELDEPETALDRVLTRIQTSGAADLRADVKIYRVKTDGSESYCGKFEVSEYDQHGDELIRAAWGSGKFRVRIYGPSMKEGSNYGKYVRLCNELVEIEPSLIPIKSNLPGAANDGDVSPVLLQTLQTMAGEIASLKAAPPVNGMAQLMETMTLLKTMGIIGGKEKPLMEQIKELDALAEFKNKHMGGDGGENKDDNSLLSLAGRAMDVIGPALQRGQQNPQPNGAHAPIVPQLAIPANFGGDETQGEDMNAGVLFMLNMAVAGLIDGAQRGDDIEVHATSIADSIPDDAIPLLENLSWFAMVKEACPKHAVNMESYRDWITKVRDRAIALLYEEPAQEPVKPVKVARVAKPAPKG